MNTCTSAQGSAEDQLLDIGSTRISTESLGGSPCLRERRRARVLPLFMTLLGLLTALAGGEVAAQCTTRDRIELLREGYPERAIRRLCGDYEEQYEPSRRQRRTATCCLTDQGRCPLPGPVDVGTPCDCYTNYGRIPGRAVCD